MDDEPLARSRVRELLATQADVEVTGECANGREAIAAIRSDRPDLVYLDVQMPEINGFEASLAARLDAIGRDGGLRTEAYRPDAYRGTLFESGPVVGPALRPWPWPGLTPADFTLPADPTGLALPRRVMTRTDVEALGDDPGGGLTGIYLEAPSDGGVYSFALRPLLPDEE